uniref:Uncharacterized protein n=1 Tax=Lactuca sativa TaxID=4236 RepID=A0A9R1UJN1_LACSA|nr:hypothetical protein LSAT_V11C900480620 [Lactuca sativa]
MSKGLVTEQPQKLSKNTLVLPCGLRFKVDFYKSKVFRIGVGERKLACNARILGCDVGSFPFNYLGVVVRANMNLIKNWKLRSPLKKFVEDFFGVEPTRKEKYFGSLGLKY